MSGQDARSAASVDYSEMFLAAYDHPAFAAATREEVGTMEEQLVEALRAIIAVPSERTLLLNAEARAMYEIARRALEEVERRG